MRYLGLDVHSRATVWCLLNQAGEVVERGKVTTKPSELEALARRLSSEDELLCGQEIGTQSYLVHDVLTAAGVKVESFNAQHLRMIASSRKKTDRRDAYWIAKALQCGMTPHPVYIPTGAVRRLRDLLSQRQALKGEQKRWRLRAGACLRATGHTVPPAHLRNVGKVLDALLNEPQGVEDELAETLSRCDRMHRALSAELSELEGTIRREAQAIEAIERLQTIPAVGEWTAVTIYAWVGDVSRFSSARRLTSYAGLAPSVRQSAESNLIGGITRQGSPALRSSLVQCGNILLFRCCSEDAAPLKAIAMRVHTSRRRRKIAAVAAARHILRIAYYVLRDGTIYDPARLVKAAE